MATKILALAALKNDGIIKKYEIDRRAPGPNDVKIDIKYCGICHSDLHQIKDEWGPGSFPMVPGHEIVGIVTEVGSAVTKFKKGDKAGIGVFVDSCRECKNCRSGDEQYCSGNDAEGALKSAAFTYNYKLPSGEQLHGGYAQTIVVDQHYALSIPDTLELAGTAPLLCAGITVYSPMKHFGVRSHHSIGVVGMGGLGHMAVKIAVAMGCDVSVISTSPKKQALAKELGAQHFIVSSSEEDVKAKAGSLDYIIDTVSAPHKLQDYLPYLRTNGTLMLVGIPIEPYSLAPNDLISKRISIGGSMIGGIQEIQEMLDFCGRHNITAMVEVVPSSYVNKALERLSKNDVKFRFVIDIAGSLNNDSPEVEDAQIAA